MCNNSGVLHKSFANNICSRGCINCRRSDSITGGTYPVRDQTTIQYVRRSASKRIVSLTTRIILQPQRAQLQMVSSLFKKRNVCKRMVSSYRLRLDHSATTELSLKCYIKLLQKAQCVRTLIARKLYPHIDCLDLSATTELTLKWYQASSKSGAAHLVAKESHTNQWVKELVHVLVGHNMSG